jgi:hypothetical protein
MFNVNIPTLKVKIIKSYLTQDGADAMLTEDAYLISAKCVSGRPILFTVHLESGAVYSSLPIEALRCTKYSEHFVYNSDLKTEELQPFTCLDGPAQLIEYEALKDYQVKTKLGIDGRYLFTIDYAGGGLAEDPEQFKTHNVIVLDSGQLCALPNNYCLFVDKHFTETKEFPKYTRSSKYYLAGS